MGNPTQTSALGSSEKISYQDVTKPAAGTTGPASRDRRLARSCRRLRVFAAGGVRTSLLGSCSQKTRPWRQQEPGLVWLCIDIERCGEGRSKTYQLSEADFVPGDFWFHGSLDELQL